MFNVREWAAEMRAAIVAKNAGALARLMSENDRNGCFAYEDACNEFGETTREEWAESTIDCAEMMLDDLPNHAPEFAHRNTDQNFTVIRVD